MASSDFQQFLDTFFGQGSDAVREGPDEAALARLQGDERTEAEGMLLERLSDNDPRPAVGLGVLGTWEAAEPIRELMTRRADRVEDVDASFLVDTSVALWRIEKAPEALDNVIRVLERSPYPTIRTHAALSLRELREPRAVEALARAMQGDPEGVVRHNAAKSLLALHGLLPDPRESPPATIRVMMGVPEVRQKAAKEILAMVRERPL